MSAVLLTPLFESILDNSGLPLAGGRIYSYQAGTTTPLATYTDASGTVSAGNYIQLDSAGRPANGGVWGSGVYKFVLQDSMGVQVGQPVDNVTAIYGSGDMTKAVYDAANIAQQVVGTAAVQDITNKTLSLTGGSTIKAPLSFTAGTNLTTSSAGAIEYDGRAFYSTPLALQRGLIQTGQQYTLDSGYVGSNVTTAQTLLGVGIASAPGATECEFEGTFYLSKSAGVTSHTISLIFNAGSATVFRFNYDFQTATNATSFSTLTNFVGGSSAVNSAVPVTSAITTANAFITIKVHGTVSISGGGSIVPGYILSAAPGGAYTTGPGSTFRIWPIGANGNVSIGSWA